MRLGKIFKASSGIVAAIVSLIAGLVLVAGAWSGEISPAEHPLTAVLVMTLPVTIPVCVLIFVLDALWWRHAALIMGLSLGLSLPAIFDVFPTGTGAFVDVPHKGAPAREITLLSYNCAGWVDLTKQYPGGENPTARLILDCDADVVALQETWALEVRPEAYLTRALVDTLHLRYPYITRAKDQRMTILSKFPVRRIELKHFKDGNERDEIAAFRLNIAGVPYDLFSVHLRSFNLTVGDKALYQDVTELDDRGDGRRAMVGKVRRSLFAKVEVAAMSRAEQVEKLVDDIRSLGSANLIVCGDFNDVPGCYALRRLADNGLREVYPAVGRGYMATFNRDRLLFRIDHVMWRGDLRPLSMQRRVTMASDHYPLLTRFRLQPAR